MRISGLALSFLVAVLLLLGAPAAPADSPAKAGDYAMVLPTEVRWADVTSLPPGAKIAIIEGVLKDPAPFTFRLKFPARYKVPVHTHPVVERVTVISGTFKLGIGDTFDPAKTKALSPGSVAIMQPGVAMFAYTDEETVIQLNGVGPWGITYVYPDDDPRKK